MLKAMVRKELRELLPIALLGIAVNMYFTLGAMKMPIGYPINDPNEIPFDGQFPVTIMLLGILTSIVIGLWQNIREETFGTFPFLLHRPISRGRIFVIKVFVGSVVSLATAFLPMFIYALWAATPGTHASPFYWDMTIWAFAVTLFSPIVYAGAFLASLRPGFWWGSRLLPALGGIAAAIALGSVIENRLLVLLPAVPLVIALIYVSILHVARSRDYA